MMSQIVCLGYPWEIVYQVNQQQKSPLHRVYNISFKNIPNPQDVRPQEVAFARSRRLVGITLKEILYTLCRGLFYIGLLFKLYFSSCVFNLLLKSLGLFLFHAFLKHCRGCVNKILCLFKT